MHGAVQPVARVVGHDSEAHTAVHALYPLVVSHGVCRVGVGPLRPLVAVVGGEARRKSYSSECRIGLDWRRMELAEHGVLSLKRNDGNADDAEGKKR